MPRVGVADIRGLSEPPDGFITVLLDAGAPAAAESQSSSETGLDGQISLASGSGRQE